MAKILVVGDDPAEQEVLSLVIEFKGHCCRVAISLEEAAKLLKRESFDLVVIEVKHDRRSSRHIVKRLKVASTDVAVMILSEGGDTAVEEADAIVAIPCSPEKLLQRIEHVLKKTVAPAGKRPRYREKVPLAQPLWRRTAKA